MLLALPKQDEPKKQITNKSQHAAQAPALRVTEIKNPKLAQDMERRACYESV